MDNHIVQALHDLVENGWLPLRRLSFLLGYRHGTGIYARQSGPHAIPYVRVGRTKRVHRDDIVHALENPLRDYQRDSYAAVLSLLRRLERQHEHENETQDT